MAIRGVVMVLVVVVVVLGGCLDAWELAGGRELGTRR